MLSGDKTMAKSQLHESPGMQQWAVAVRWRRLGTNSELNRNVQSRCARADIGRYRDLMRANATTYTPAAFQATRAGGSRRPPSACN